MTDAERWERARALFDTVVERPPGERARFLDDACAGDAELRAEVDALVAADERNTDFLDRPAGDVAAALIDEMAAARFAGQRIGNYRILRKLGEGGMGIVFEAEQETPRRLVALKLIRGGAFLDESRIRLFQREAQSLALLRHPSIAVIYEAGRSGDGQHFFAMELVHGVPLDGFLRGRAASIADRGELRLRLAVFLRICEAIAYAHDRGVIHRDLKPSNILVSSAAEVPDVKILDFGLARITSTEVTMAGPVTRSGQVQGTLAYMSPEQARGDGDGIDERTDVYALGVLLYEMLVGRPPYDLSRTMLHESVRVICEQDPVRPGALEPTLRGDLETILLKALEKEPARRYPSAASLADDLLRFLADEPILARPASTAYQVRKLVARHRRLTGAIAGVFVLLLAFGIAMAFMFGQQRKERVRADAQRARAEQEAEKARRTSGFVAEMLSSVDPGKSLGKEVTVRDVLDESSRRVETELVDQPEVAASIRATIGNTYQALGLYDAAEPHFRAALATRRAMPGGDSEDLATSLDDLGHLLMLDGDYDGARPLLEESVTMRARLSGQASAAMANTLSNLASMRAYTADYQGADSLWQETLAIQRALAKRNDIEEIDIAITLNNLGNVALNQRELERAEPLLRESLAMQERILGDDHPDVAEVASGIAVLLLEKGDNAGAEAMYREALATLRRSYGNEHPKVARTLAGLAVTLNRLERYDEAESLHREALALRRKLLGDHPDVAASLQSLAASLGRRGDFAGAEALLREALRIMRATLPAENWSIALAENDLGGCLLELARYEEAEVLLTRSLARLEDAVGPSARQRDRARDRMAKLDTRLGRSAAPDTTGSP